MLSLPTVSTCFSLSEDHLQAAGAHFTCEHGKPGAPGNLHPTPVVPTNKWQMSMEMSVLQLPCTDLDSSEEWSTLSLELLSKMEPKFPFMGLGRIPYSASQSHCSLLYYWFVLETLPNTLLSYDSSFQVLLLGISNQDSHHLSGFLYLQPKAS